MWCATWLLCSGVALGGLPSPGPAVGKFERPEASKGFSAILLLSDKPADVLRAWQTATAGAPAQAVDTISRGVPIVAFVFFTGCTPDKNGLCNASVDFTIHRSDGSVYASFSDRELWKGKPAPPEGTLRLSAEHVGVIIEPEDPLGRYEVRVSVHDLNAGTTLELRQALTATPAGR